MTVKNKKMNYILFDGAVRNALLPFTFTRPVADIRVGILTLREKWEKHLGLTTTTITEEYLEEKYPMVEMERNILINASFCPTKELVRKIKNLSETIILGTAHPYKFLETVKKATGIEVIPPSQLSNIVDKEERFDILDNNISKIKNYILEKTI